MTTLHVYTDGCEWYVAESLEAACAMHDKLAGYEWDPEAVEQMEGGDTVGIMLDDKGEPIELPGPEGYPVTTKTAAEWCSRGPGFLCTTEY